VSYGLLRGLLGSRCAGADAACTRARASSSDQFADGSRWARCGHAGFRSGRLTVGWPRRPNDRIDHMKHHNTP